MAVLGRDLVRDLAVGAVAGYLGNRAMDRATTFFQAHQSEASRAREREVSPDGAPLLAGRRVANLFGREPNDDEAARWAEALHRGSGIPYGVAAAALSARGMPPSRAGLLVAAVAFVVVDEGLVYTFLPPPSAYPVESHLRGAFGHLVLGATTGAVLAFAHRAGLTSKTGGSA